MFADPIKNLKQFGIAENMIVADLGAGSGFYSIPAAHMATNGKVYAIEVQRDFLTTIKIKATDAGLSNLNFIWGDIEKVGGTKIKEGLVDRVIASNILFQVIHKQKFIDEAHRITKKGGKILLIDWADASFVGGPKSDVLISKEKALKMFLEKGFVHERDIDAGAHHYGMIFSKT